MNRSIVYTLIILLLISVPLSAQVKTLAGNSMESGGFGGPAVKLTRVNGQFALMAGGGGAWLINHVFAIGGGGFFMTDAVEPPAPADSLDLGIAYGGMFMEYITRWEEVVHFTFHLFLGGGGVSLEHPGTDHAVEEDGFFVLEPGVNAEINLTQTMRLNAGVSYRYITGVDLTNVSSADLNCFSFNLYLKFGRF
jgi:hypothetical protein